MERLALAVEVGRPGRVDRAAESGEELFEKVSQLPSAVWFGVAGVSCMALTQAMSANPQLIGSASGLYGFAQMAYGALCAGLVSIGDDPSLAAALVQAGSAITAQLCFWYGSGG